VRRLFLLAVAVAVAWWFIHRRRRTDDVGATVGYADGSAVTFEPGSLELERLLHIAAEARAG
jgi:hypothetical protein